jgi:DNA-binding MarR family transcriptional regulator
MGKKGKGKDKGSKGKGHTPDAGAASSRPRVDAGQVDAGQVDAGQVATRLNASAIHLLRRLHREDAALGLSSTRLSALSVLVLGGARTLGQLADAEGVTPPSMTRLVTAMEEDGLVERSRSQTDGRLVIVSATARGAELLHAGRDERVEVLAGMVRALPVDDQRTLERAAWLLEELLRPARQA